MEKFLKPTGAEARARQCSEAVVHSMARKTPSPSSDSEGDAGCVLTFYDDVDSEVESHFMRALQRATARSDSGDEWQEGASPTPASDRCSTGTPQQSPSQARPSPVPSDSVAFSSRPVAEETLNTVSSPPISTTASEITVPTSYPTDNSQVFLYPPPPYSQHGAAQRIHPYTMVLPPHLLRAKLLQPHFLQQLVQPDEYAMDEAELPRVPGQGKPGDIPWPQQFVKRASNREGGGSIYSSPHCNLIGQHPMTSSRGTVHYPPAHSMEHVCPTSSPAYNSLPVCAPPPTPLHPPPQPLQDMHSTDPLGSQALQAL